MKLVSNQLIRLKPIFGFALLVKKEHLPDIGVAEKILIGMFACFYPMPCFIGKLESVFMPDGV